MKNPWIRLWELARDDRGRVVDLIGGDHHGPEYATLVWPDGSRTTLTWHDGDWQFPEANDTYPCDVGSRDAL